MSQQQQQHDGDDAANSNNSTQPPPSPSAILPFDNDEASSAPLSPAIEGGSANSLLFRDVNADVVANYHAWQSPASPSLSYDVAAEASHDAVAIFEALAASPGRDEEEDHDDDDQSTPTVHADHKAIGMNRRTAETRYAPGLSTFLSLDSRTVAENVRSALITLPPIDIDTAKRLLEGLPVKLYLGSNRAPPHLISLYASHDESQFVDEPEDEGDIDPLEFVVPWLPPALLGNMADYALRVAGQVYLGTPYGSGGASEEFAVPPAILNHWAAWQRALLDPMHRLWRLAYVRLARVADMHNRPFCYQLVASSWREQYALVMRMYTHVNVSLLHPLDMRMTDLERYDVLRRADNMFRVDTIVPNTLCAVGAFGLTLVIDTRVSPAAVSVSQSDEALRRTLTNLAGHTMVVRSMGAVSFAVSLTLINALAIGTSVVAVQRLSGRFDQLEPNNARANGALYDNEIELLWVTTDREPYRVRVGSAVRTAMGEPDPRMYESELRDVVGGSNNADTDLQEIALNARYDCAIGRSRLQLYIVAPHDAAPLALAQTPFVGTAALHRQLIAQLHLDLRRHMVHQHVLLPRLYDADEWKQYSNQALWSDFDTYTPLTNRQQAQAAFDHNRAITVRVLFEAYQLSQPDERDTCVLRPLPATAGYLLTPEERARPLRTSLLFVGNSALCDSVHEDVTVQLLPSSCVRSYLALYSNGLSNTPHDIGHANRQHVARSLQHNPISTYLAATTTSHEAGTRERAAILLTQPVGPADLPVLDAQAWCEQNDPPVTNPRDPHAPLHLVDDSLAEEIEHVRAWPAGFAPPFQKGQSDVLLPLVAQMARRIPGVPNREMHGTTSFYQDVRRYDADADADGKRHVRIGLWLDGLHPRPTRMRDEMRSAVLVHDPDHVLLQHGIDTLRVMVYVNYHDAQGRHYCNAPPVSIAYALHHDSISDRMVALPYAGDPVLNAHDWIGEQPLLVHGSTLETNAPGMMLSKKLSAPRGAK